VILANDSGTDNWFGEYAMLLANSGGPKLAGIIVNPSSYAPNLATSVAAWDQMIAAARESGLRNIPDATASAGEPLVRPANGLIESTAPNSSAGANLIVDLSARLSLPWRPLVVVTGSRLTDVADAYIMDNTVVDRVVVVSALGGAGGGGGAMGWPNGELDPWADWIVGQRFRYIQVNGFYDHAVIDPSAVFDPTTGPPLVAQAEGLVWVVPSCDTAMAADRLWKMLQDPRTFGN
jgi:hypothetical protein